ncbi:hypothetical protein [Rhodoligotrophos ferricapiens]|uniref:hypothetical protein n=1 Tax=Rhodoligotrophos ferricapiens TaxID=3069264 RepID=UPI00315C9147
MAKFRKGDRVSIEGTVKWDGPAKDGAVSIEFDSSYGAVTLYVHESWLKPVKARERAYA